MGRRSGGQTGSMPLRPGRSGHTGGRGPVGGAGEEQRAIAPPTQARETAELPGPSPALQSPLQTTWVLGGIGGRPGRSGEAGWQSHPGGVREEWRAIAPPTRAQEACWARR